MTDSDKLHSISDFLAKTEKLMADGELFAKEVADDTRIEEDMTKFKASLWFAREELLQVKKALTKSS
jgi:hypothetical protein